ncbi:uncharacterized protein [Gossypium hirsutum]|uniref:Uncharacterized protein isoform X3 n=1 Tax=Gossypium hirsutum TaxID=3635 RepID=A0ABM3BNX2_GOSHI|nr:uncharacterized protein LOC107916901 isoform X3 [Gossypium hirsutum]
MTACRHAFDSAVVRSPVLPIGTSCCILFTKGNDKTASTCSPSRVGSQASFQIFVDSPFLILQLVPSSSELCAFQMLCLVKEGPITAWKPSGPFPMKKEVAILRGNCSSLDLIRPSIQLESA